jgi:hypothetical protein
MRSVGQAARALDEGRRLAEEHGRPDLSAHLQAAGERLAARLFPVAIVGEFKRGKSTLVNALIQTDVCPVDADIVTAVPTLVRFGEEASATALLQAEPVPGQAERSPEPVAEPVDVDRLMALVGESADPAWRRRLQSVEVRLPHRLLRSGLALVDTPGVGGLESAHGQVTLGALARTSALIFVTDASQELTAPEVDFLRTALERCPTGVCVVTKTDLYPQWRRIVELDRGHLAAAGIDMPVVPVSSFLRLRAWREPELNEESGFAPLFDWLREAVVEAAAAELAGAAQRDLGFVQNQLRAELTAELQVIEAPDERRTESVVEELHKKHERTRRLVADRAGWKQALFDGVEDLFADVRHDLSERLRLLTREAEGVIDQGDPKETWPDVEVWLQRQLVGVATANYDLLTERAQELAADVAEQFRLESEVPLDLGLTAPAEVLRGLSMDPGDVDAAGGQRLARMVFAGRTAIIIPYVVFGVMGGAGFILLATLGPLSLVLGAGIGRKLLRDERQRQLTYRRQQAKIACRRYLDEAAFVIGKDCQDSLRRTRRELRDEFEARAALLNVSAERALLGAQRAAGLTPEEQHRRARELAERQRRIDRLGGPARGAA